MQTQIQGGSTNKEGGIRILGRDIDWRKAVSLLVVATTALSACAPAAAPQPNQPSQTEIRPGITAAPHPSTRIPEKTASSQTPAETITRNGVTIDIVEYATGGNFVDSKFSRKGITIDMAGGTSPAEDALTASPIITAYSENFPPLMQTAQSATHDALKSAMETEINSGTYDTPLTSDGNKRAQLGFISYDKGTTNPNNPETNIRIPGGMLTFLIDQNGRIISFKSVNHFGDHAGQILNFIPNSEERVFFPFDFLDSAKIYFQPVGGQKTKGYKTSQQLVFKDNQWVKETKQLPWNDWAYLLNDSAELQFNSYGEKK